MVQSILLKNASVNASNVFDDINKNGVTTGFKAKFDIKILKTSISAVIKDEVKETKSSKKSNKKQK